MGYSSTWVALALPAGGKIVACDLNQEYASRARRTWRETGVEEKIAEGQIRRWAVEGPSNLQLKRTGFDPSVLKPGMVIEVCGYAPKEATTWQIASADPSATSLAGRLLNAELLVMPDGHEQSWGDYGAHHCFAPGEFTSGR